MTEERRTGRTTQQMLNAPRGAYYVWETPALSYAKQLAEYLKRTDLKIVSAGFFSYKGRGAGLKAKIIIDHGCVLTVSAAAAIGKHNLLDKS
jgi:hypothetical protein